MVHETVLTRSKYFSFERHKDVCKVCILTGIKHWEGLTHRLGLDLLENQCTSISN